MIAQMTPLQVFHGYIRKATFLADIIYRHDVRVVEPAGRLRFAKEACPGLDQFGIAEFARQRDRLDGHRTVDGGVAPQIDDAHGAAADLTLQFVTAETLRLRSVRRRSTRRALRPIGIPG